MHHLDFYECVKNTPANATEVEFRNAISRIYYCVYHEILSLIEKYTDLKIIYDELKGQYSSHKLLQNVFFTYTTRFKNLQYTHIAKSLETLHNLRCDADYHLDEQIKFADYNSMLFEVQDLQQKIRRIYKDAFNMEIKSPSKTTVFKRGEKVDNSKDEKTEKSTKPNFQFVD